MATPTPSSSTSSSSSSSSDSYDMALIAYCAPRLNAQAAESSTARFDSRTAKLNRNRAAGHQLLYRDYFADDSVYNDRDFKRRFRLSKNLFMRTSERTVRESMYNFAEGVVEIFGPIYLRKPTVTDVQNLYAHHEEKHGFPGMLGSIDCTQWDWRNCPQAWRGEYTGGHHGTPSLVLEAVASQDLWFWHAFFGVAGSNNDVNVLDQSPIYNEILTGRAPDAPFVVNENHYRFGYYLTDGIYPRHATFVKAYRHPSNPKQTLFTQKQESASKDVERAFGVLKSKWHVVKNAARTYQLHNLRSIMYACIIMHNMVVEDKGRNISHYVSDGPRETLYVPGTAEYLRRVVNIRDNATHDRLQVDLAEHFYNNRNQNPNEDNNEDED